jgi:large subunit ribosomal protein L9
MKVILTQDVPNLGDEGDVVKVAAGYFRNYLSPRRMAALSTPGNLKELEFKKKRLEKIRAERQAEAEKLAGKVQNLEVTVRQRCGEKGQLFGSVTNAQIAQALEKAGYEIDRRKILVNTPIKTIGEHSATLRIYTGVEAKIKVFVKPEADQEEEIYEAMARSQRLEDEAHNRAREAREREKRIAKGEDGEDGEGAEAAEAGKEAGEAKAEPAAAKAEEKAPSGPIADEEKKPKKASKKK